MYINLLLHNVILYCAEYCIVDAKNGGPENHLWPRARKFRKTALYILYTIYKQYKISFETWWSSHYIFEFIISNFYVEIHAVTKT